jgi:phosphoribosylformimino-5-aminoimidazole carboxamide ribotide isomerase
MKDGTLEGPNFEGLQTMAKAAAMPVIASGGVGSLGDIERIAELSGLGIEGVIVGMALYTGKLSLADAIDTLRGRDV